jgi:uncharacterized membrane protein
VWPEHVYRHLTRGKTPANERAGERTMNEFQLTITVERPVEAVWTYFQDFSR